MQSFAVNAMLWMGFGLGTAAAAVAAIPLPNSSLAHQEAKHLDRLPRSHLGKGSDR